ncbi:helix-turn-helix domain-containing protein [Alcaligenes sp. SDU_A2]|uniref:helix-turn-helix domain-containing protein n=1 Tax=Alcaligenes sp. SDU_A2 TaxID=3136634 RepID=UPI00311EE496
MTALQHMVLQLTHLQNKPDRDTQVLQLSKAGLSLNQIAVEVGVSRTTVFNIINAQRGGKTQ